MDYSKEDNQINVDIRIFFRACSLTRENSQNRVDLGKISNDGSWKSHQRASLQLTNLMLRSQVGIPEVTKLVFRGARHVNSPHRSDQTP